MRSTAATLVLLACAVCSLAAEPPAGAPPHSEMKTIASLDVPRYMGTWYEVARYPNRFQKMCASDTRAEYSQQPNGTVQVINQCRLASGELTQAVGTVRQVGGPQSPRLEVRFAPAWLSFLPWVWGDYWVIDLDADYSLAAVSEPKREFLWILSRTPRVNPAVYDALLARLASKGFDLKLLETSLHSP